jgi:uncharacterized membrane protein YuzA (DUF378 family)
MATKQYKGWMLAVPLLALVAGLNWVLVGLFQFDLVAALTGELTWLATVLYVLAGGSAAWIAGSELL